MSNDALVLLATLAIVIATAQLLSPWLDAISQLYVVASALVSAVLVVVAVAITTMRDARAASNRRFAARGVALITVAVSGAGGLALGGPAAGFGAAVSAAIGAAAMLWLAAHEGGEDAESAG